jgi:hypothetical protein
MQFKNLQSKLTLVYLFQKKLHWKASRQPVQAHFADGCVSSYELVLIWQLSVTNISDSVSQFAGRRTKLVFGGRNNHTR